MSEQAEWVRVRLRLPASNSPFSSAWGLASGTGSSTCREQPSCCQAPTGPENMPAGGGMTHR